MAGTSVDVISKANSAFVDENYAEALNLYNKAVEEDPSNGEVYVKRSHAHFKLGNWEGAATDVDKAFERGCKKSAKLLFRKGQALFHLDKYDKAKEVLEEGLLLDGADSEFAVWIEKCKEEIKLLEKAKETVVVPPAPAKIRHEWYQTESHVTITILLKNQKPEDIKANFTDTTISFTAKLPSGDAYELSLNLAHPIVAEQTTYKCYSTKIEIKAKKQEGIKWTSLEFDSSAPDVPASMMFSVPEATGIEKVPPVFKTKNWDSIVKETENEKEEGDAALNALFQKIYAEGSDEVRRAMNKSFVESGGTVLSTNWEEISSKTTPVKPPDGMEYRKWTE
ncbi:protein SGT1 homolog [Dermacentor andersoni]|uniref:protein SGT1 homolog n=1 Tax=Dermacentor andersoni TaxID=34620 RepID=UPI0021559137|nr:protein SGT1 homolog [Dermacentor andersoni]